MRREKMNISDGVWPTMVTPFTAAGKIDFTALEAMVEWYVERGVNGLFAVCQSSEMFHLSLAERTALAKFVKERTAGRIPVIASGHISDSPDEQIDEVRRMTETGVDAVVLVSNRFALPGQSDEVWTRNLEHILSRIPEYTPLGMYECPHPYKRLISDRLMRWLAASGRFLFLKDTSCHVDDIKGKLRSVQGSPLKIFNANAATLLDSLREGASGYSGIMANFHPELYVWLFRNRERDPRQAAQLMNFLGLASVIEYQCYPVNAKYYMQLEGLPIQLHSRTQDMSGLTASKCKEVEQLHALSKEYADRYAP